MKFASYYPSPIGQIGLASRDGNALSDLWLDTQRYPSESIELRENLPVFRLASQWLDQYFAGLNPSVLPPLAPEGSPFRTSVWRILLEIPYGQTTTYGAIAKHLSPKTGSGKMSAQAVGTAVGHNPIAILIPCHRVIAAGGKIGGYDGGLEKKRFLMAVEKIELA